jgi:hypothetical protein
MSSFIILIDNDDDAEKIELAMNQNNILFDIEIIKDKSELIYEFTINLIHKKYVLFLIKDKNINVLEFISN